MTSISANLTKNVALAEKPLNSQGMISISPSEEASILPLDLVLILDVSGSMAGEKIQLVIDSVLFLQSQLGPNDRLAIITFNGSAQLHTNWVGKNDTIQGLSAGGGTNFGAAINQLLNFLGQNGGDPSKAGVALFMSDGEARKASDDHVSEIPEFGYTMHCVGMTSAANPDTLEHMAELARGRYFDATDINDIQQKFSRLFNYAKTTILSAPLLSLDVKPGVTISELMEVNGTALAPAAQITSGKHDFALCNMTQGNISQVSFKVSVDNVKLGNNDLININFEGANCMLKVKGVNDGTEVLAADTNNAVTVSRTTARATRALKDGNSDLATKLVTKLETMGATVPEAGQSATILGTITKETNKGTIHETIGTITVNTKGETVTRDD